MTDEQILAAPLELNLERSESSNSGPISQEAGSEPEEGEKNGQSNCWSSVRARSGECMHATREGPLTNLKSVRAEAARSTVVTSGKTLIGDPVRVARHEKTVHARTD